MSEETCPDCGRLFATTAHEQTRETWCNGTDTHGCLRHQAARERAGNNQTNLLLTLEKSYTSTLEEKLSVATARLENILDSSKEGAWMARALDAERELSAATARASELERELEGCVTVDTALASQDELAALVAQRDAELSALGERVARAERENEAWRALVHWTHRGIDRGLDAYDDDVLIVAADKVVFIGKSALECAENIPAVKQKLGLLQPETSARRST